MKKKTLFLLILLSTQVFAISDLEKLLLKEAVTPEAKKTAKEYFLKRALDYKDLAIKYENLAKGPQGGKALSEMQNANKFKNLAEEAREEAIRYQKEADKL
ncbi:hypothetical protein LPTSP4_00420 [Leptospira ryugenii]|uniref:Uncharacterized protein n=1 Tax=Leptospira ryugenii TaxID=1917863 RepID=A0A2P2DVC4_9LEPT|nr:hypothetical protein [Leptospira ryugenii]GBF48543.1 hypothetical protein LPTSP4_00420 [Leptospira ryugenii]